MYTSGTCMKRTYVYITNMCIKQLGNFKVRDLAKVFGWGGGGGILERAMFLASGQSKRIFHRLHWLLDLRESAYIT